LKRAPGIRYVGELVGSALIWKWGGNRILLVQLCYWQMSQFKYSACSFIYLDNSWYNVVFYKIIVFRDRRITITHSRCVWLMSQSHNISKKHARNKIYPVFFDYRTSSYLNNNIHFDRCEMVMDRK
jgi:hypothetical protein